MALCYTLHHEGMSLQEVLGAPECMSFVFDKDGKVSSFTGGYIMDRLVTLFAARPLCIQASVLAGCQAVFGQHQHKIKGISALLPHACG